MEAVVDDGRLRAGLLGGGSEVGAHVHRGGNDDPALVRGQRFQQRDRVGGAAAGDDFQHPAVLQVGHQRDVVLAAAKALFRRGRCG